VAIPELVTVLPTVTVVIPTYQRAYQFEESVRAVLADDATTECIVSIDGSKDGSYEVALRLSEEDGRVVPLFNEHSGKNGAIMAALAVAKGDVVLLLDDDIVAGPGLVTGHARHHLANEHLVAMGYTPCVPPQKKSSVLFLSKLWGREYEDSCVEIEANPDSVLGSLWGGNVSIRREDWLKVGLRIPNFAHEDTDLGLRCRWAGCVGTFDRSLYAEHHHEPSGRSFLRASRSFGAGRWLLHYDHADILGPYRSEWDSDSRWAPSRVLLHIGRSPKLAHGLAVMSLFVGWSATQLKIEPIESLAYRFARILEIEVGATLMSGMDESEIVDQSRAAHIADADTQLT
jgi:glycosyltransferase involved in cell wall biosynthesis